MGHRIAALHDRDHAEWGALIGAYLPQLQRFAERRLPVEIRGTIGADDLVQEAVLGGIKQLHHFEFRHEQAFLAYLFTSIRHRIVDEIRRRRRQPALVPLAEHGNANVDPAMSPLQRVIATENMGRYARAFARLADRDRQLIVLRMERGLTYLDVAARLGMSTEVAVRMAIRRALRRLERKLNQLDAQSPESASSAIEDHACHANPPKPSMRRPHRVGGSMPAARGGCHERK